MSARHDNAGFTLIEVLVALAIVGMALGAIAAVFSTALLGHQTADSAEQALAVAEEQLALAAAVPRPGKTGGTFAGRFAWRTSVEPYADGKENADIPTSLPPLYRIDVTVAWHDGRRGREVALSTLRLGTATP